MKNLSMMCATFIAVLTAIAADPLNPTFEVSDMMHLNNIPEFVKATGGIVEVKTAGTAFLFVDATKERVDFSNAMAKMREQCLIPFEVKYVSHKEGCLYNAARSMLDLKKHGALVYIYDGAADEPTLVAYPENRITILNVTPLRVGDANRFRGRYIKELWRALCFAAGGATTGVPMCVMKAVLSVDDLDEMKCAMASPPATSGITQAAPKYGFMTISQMTFYDALKNGYSLKPTNDVQRAVAEKAKKDREEALKNPSKPMKIKFDKKQGK